MNESDAAKLLGRLGGLQRAKNLTRDERSEIAKLAVTKRNQKLSNAERSRIARLAAQARWNTK